MNMSTPFLTIDSVKEAMEEANEGLITKRAKEVGFTECLKTVKQLEDFFIKGKDYGVHTVTSNKDPNKNILNTTIEIVYNDTSEIINLSIIPNKNDTCSYSYTQTHVVNQSCDEYVKKSLVGFSNNGTLSKRIFLMTKDSLSFYLLDTKSGCLVQKRETTF